MFYLPAVLLPAQEELLAKRKEEETAAAEQDWAAWKDERAQGVQEIATLRAKVAEYEEGVKGAKKSGEDEAMVDDKSTEKKDEVVQEEDAHMDVDDGPKEEAKAEESPAPPPAPVSVPPPVAPAQPDEVDAVEY